MRRDARHALRGKAHVTRMPFPSPQSLTIPVQVVGRGTSSKPSPAGCLRLIFSTSPSYIRASVEFSLLFEVDLELCSAAHNNCCNAVTRHGEYISLASQPMRDQVLTTTAVHFNISTHVRQSVFRDALLKSKLTCAPRQGKPPGPSSAFKVPECAAATLL